MNNKSFFNFCLAAGISATGCISANALTIEEYCTPSMAAPASVKDITPMADGFSYCAVSDNGRDIEVFSYKTGKKLSTLFSLDGVKGEIKIDSFDGYELSANEKKILLWNNVEKIYRHSFTADYYVYDIMRSTLAKVSDKGAQRGCVISHDGRMVAYSRDNNVWISNLDYGTDKAITEDGVRNKVINGASDWSYEEEFGLVNTLRWSGDDTVLAFMRFDESEVPVYSFDNYKSYCDPDPLSDPYPASYSYKYPLAGYPVSKVSVLAYNLDNRVSKKMDLPIDSDYIPSIEFDGEGKNLMIMLLNRNQNDLRLFKVNPASTVAHMILQEKCEAWMNPSAFQMVKYFDRSFIIGSEISGWLHLYEYDYNGNKLRQLTKGDWNVTQYYGKNTRTGRHYFQCTKLGAVNRNVASVDAKGLMTLLNDMEGTENASFSRNLEYYVRNYSNVSTPNQYTVCDNNGKCIKKLQMNEEYAAKYAMAPRKELTKVKNAAGEEMDAYIIKPANFNASGKYPLLMYQYNGPDSQEVLNRWKMEGVFYLASQGYVVAAVDGRGTGNRGRVWSTCVYKKLGQYETEDQIAGAKSFSKLPYIDSSKVGCFGWSYGGYMTLMELSAKGNPFKVGVSMAPVTDWRFYDAIYTERYMLTPQQNKSGYDAASTFDRISDMNSRLLIMSGTSDDNVHFYNTLKYTSKLFSEGKVFDMMALTGFEHSLPKCNARAMLFKKIADFLDKNLK